MSALLLHDFHAARGAAFLSLNGVEAVQGYGGLDTEYRHLTENVGIIDLSFRGRVCLLGNDREKFLHGQITNDLLRLKTGQGCYAALLSAKAKMESDLFAYKLPAELLLDFEPGLTERITERLNRFVIAEDVQVVDVAPHYGLLHLSGPLASQVLESLGLPGPGQILSWLSVPQPEGEVYVINNPRARVPGYDLFIPTELVLRFAEKLATSTQRLGGGWAGWNALETVRIENAVPRFGADMTESTIPQEAELQHNAISFSKGCYIGQEIVARIRTYGQVAKALRLIRFSEGSRLPEPATPILLDEKPIGVVTSSTYSPKYKGIVALGFVRKEHFSPGTKVSLGDSLSRGEIVGIPGALSSEASGPATPNKY